MVFPLEAAEKSREKWYGIKVMEVKFQIGLQKKLYLRFISSIINVFFDVMVPDFYGNIVVSHVLSNSNDIIWCISCFVPLLVFEAEKD